MKKILLGFISFIVLLGAMAIVVPFLINVNDYKPQILAKAREALGRDLKIDGNMQLRLLPQVRITLENIQLANAKGGSEPTMASIEKIHLKLAFWPLLKKKINIQKIELVKPTVFLEHLSNGQGNWEFNSTTTNSASLQNVSTSLDVKEGPASKDFDINVQSLKITDGVFQYKDGKIVHKIHHIISEISLDSREGLAHAKGELSYGDQPLNFDVNLGKFQENQPLVAKFNSGSCVLDIDGTLQKTNFVGHLKTDIDFIELEKISGLKIALPSTLGPKVVITSDVTTTGKSVKLDQLKIKADQLDAQGSFNIDYDPEVKIEGTLENLPGKSRLMITSHQTTQERGGSLEIQVDQMKQLLEFLQQNTKSIPKELLEKSTLKANYKITPTSIQIHNLNLNLHLTTLTGDVAFGINAPKPSLMIDLKTENILPIMILAGTPAKSNQKMPGTLKGTIEGDVQSFTFDTQSQLGRTSILAQGNGRQIDKQLQIASSLHVKSASFVNLLQQFGIEIPDMFNQTTIDGDIAQKGAEIQLNTSVQTGELIFQTKGAVINNPQSPQFNLTISASHPNLRQLLGRLGASTTAPAGNFSLDGHLEGSPATTLNLNSLKGKLGSAGSFKGSIGYKGATQNSKPHISTNLSFHNIDLENLLAFTNYAVIVPAFSGPQIILAAAVAHKKSPWSQEKLDLQFLNYVDADIKIDATQLIKGDLIFDNVSLNADVNQGVLNVHEIKSNFYGGVFDLKGQTNSQKNNASHYQFSLKGAELKNLSPKEGAIKITQGRMDIEGDLQTAGNSVHHLIEALRGKMPFHAQDGMISGFDLQAVTSNLMKQNRLEGVSNLLRTSLKQGQTPFSALDGYVDIQQGIAHLKDVKLVAQGGEGSVQGTINLPAYEMNVGAQFILTDLKNIPPFGVQFTGPLDAPVRTIDSTGLEKFMMQNVLSIVNDAMKSGKIKPKDLLNSFLGKSKSDAPADASNQPSTPAAPSQAPQADNPPLQDLAKNPEKAIEGLLKGFL
ncbi:MAG: AsmA family protein [Janthinobacterium lividum]